MDSRDRRILDIANLQQTQNIDMHLRRVTNAAPSVNSGDYVTRSEVFGSGGGGGSITGSGTIGNLAKFITASSLGDSKAKESGNLVIIGSGTAVNPGVLATVKEFVVHSDLSATTTEAAMFVQCGAYTSSSPASVEKMGILSLIYQEDPSNYGLSINRDAVAIDARGISVSGNLFARVWGAYFEGNIASGSEGVANAIEASIVNYGTNETSIDQITTKVGIALNTRGLNPGTTAVNITPTWNHGIISRADAVNVSFIQLYKTATFTPLFRVNPTGQTLIGDLPNAATTGTYDPTTFGIAVFRTQITVVDNTSNKNLLSIFSDTGSSRHRITTGHYDTPGSTWPLSLEINGTASQIINIDGAILFGLASTEFTIAYGNVAVKNYVFVTDAIINSHVAVVATDAGSSSVIFGSDKTGSATVYPIIFRIGSNNLWKLNASGILNPIADATYDIGDASHRVQYLYGTGIISGTTSIALVAGGLEFYQSSTLRASITSGGFDGPGSAVTAINASNIASGSLALARITTGTDTYVLTMVSGVAAWAAPSGGGGGITGSGTTGKIPKWSSSSALTDSLLSDDATNITLTGGSLIFSATGKGIIYSTTSIALTTSGLEFYQSSTLRVTITSGGFDGPGSAITALNASNIASGTLSDSRLSANVLFTSSSLPAANLTGSIADARLSSNVPLKNAANTFTAQINLTSQNVVFSAGFGVGNSSNTAVAFASGGLEFYVGGNLKGTIGSSDTTLVIDGTVRTLHYTAGTCTLT